MKEWTQGFKGAANAELYERFDHLPATHDDALILQMELMEARELLESCNGPAYTFGSIEKAIWITLRKDWLSRNAAPEKEGGMMSKFPAEPRYSPQHKDRARAGKTIGSATTAVALFSGLIFPNPQTQQRKVSDAIT